MIPGARPPTPAEIASWPAPNYVNPHTRRPLLLGIDIPLCILVLFFVGGRFYGRTVIRWSLGADDWIMLVATVISIAAVIMECVSTSSKFQTGYHLWDLTPALQASTKATGQMALATQVLFIPVCALTKISVCLTYLRIFPSRTTKHFCWGFIGFETAWCIAITTGTLFQCTPVAAYWQAEKYPDYTCINQSAFLYANVGLNSFSDFCVFLWPVRELWRVQIPFRQRVQLIMMFAVGVVVCVAGICRLWYLTIYFNSYDNLWNGAVVYVIYGIETNFGIICGCLPGCKPLMVRLFPSIFASTEGSSNHRSRTRTNGVPNSQSFPFQELRDGIVKQQDFSVSYNTDDDRKEALPSKVTVKTGTQTSNAGSEEWIVPPRPADRTSA